MSEIGNNPDRTVTGEAHWFDSDEFPPPKGVTMLLLTREGILIKGTWEDDCGLVAWSPMPRIPPNIKAKIRRLRGY